MRIKTTTNCWCAKKNLNRGRAIRRSRVGLELVFRYRFSPYYVQEYKYFTINKEIYPKKQEGLGIENTFCHLTSSRPANSFWPLVFKLVKQYFFVYKTNQTFQGYQMPFLFLHLFFTMFHEHKDKQSSVGLFLFLP